MNNKKRTILEIERNNYQILSKNRGRIDNSEKEKSLTFNFKEIQQIPKRLVIRSFSNEPAKYNLPKDEWIDDLTSNDLNCRVAVYTCIFGNYDSLQEPEFFAENIDYFVFSDTNPNSMYWKYLPTPDYLKEMNSILLNRYLKMHPSELFEDYDYVIYVDGNVKIISDVSGSIKRVNQDFGIALHNHARRNCAYKEAVALKWFKKGNSERISNQMENYKQKGFPKNYGLLEATIIISNPNSKIANQIFHQWWDEFIKSKSMRDQLSLPYVLWRSDIPIKMIGTLGTNLYRNPKYRVINHK